MYVRRVTLDNHLQSNTHMSTEKCTLGAISAAASAESQSIAEFEGATVSSSMLKGSCECRQTTFILTNTPIVHNACHCRDCQKRSGSVCALSVLIEPEYIDTSGSPEQPKTYPTPEGPNSNTVYITVCGLCDTVLWRMIPSWLDGINVVRAGPLEEAEKNVHPTVHIFVRSKHPWVHIPEGAQAYEAFPPSQVEWLGEEGLKRVEVATRKAREAKQATADE